jgi:hypothetical protein
LGELYGEFPARSQPVLGTQVFELAIRSSGLSYRYPRDWQVTLGAGTIHTTTALQQRWDDWSAFVTIGYGSANREF